jgi:hypothetical protein
VSSRLVTDGAWKGNPAPGGWADRLTRHDLPSYHLEWRWPRSQYDQHPPKAHGHHCGVEVNPGQQ